MVAVNDGILLEACIFRVLQRHFRDQQYYVQLMELFHEVRLADPSAVYGAVVLEGVACKSRILLWYTVCGARICSRACLLTIAHDQGMCR